MEDGEQGRICIIRLEYRIHVRIDTKKTHGAIQQNWLENQYDCTAFFLAFPVYTHLQLEASNRVAESNLYIVRMGKATRSICTALALAWNCHCNETGARVMNMERNSIAINT